MVVVDQCKDGWDKWNGETGAPKGNCVTGHLDLGKRKAPFSSSWFFQRVPSSCFEKLFFGVMQGSHFCQSVR